MENQITVYEPYSKPATIRVFEQIAQLPEAVNLVASVVPVEAGANAEMRRALALKALGEFVLSVGSSDNCNRILACTTESILQTCATGAATGLSFLKGMDECYPVPYYNKELRISVCQFQASYKGMTKLVTRACQVRNIDAKLVYAGENFHPVGGTSPHIDHDILLSLQGKMNLIEGGYAIAHFADGSTQFEVFSKDELDKIRNCTKKSKSGAESPAWRFWAEEMYKKGMVKRLCKKLPKLGTQEDQAHLQRLMEYEHTLTTIEPKMIEAISDERAQGTLSVEQDLGAVEVEMTRERLVAKIETTLKSRPNDWEKSPEAFYDTASKNLAKEIGHDPTPEELCTAFSEGRAVWDTAEFVPKEPATEGTEQ